MILATSVAPRAGAWIETFFQSRLSLLQESHPVRVRGLKHILLTLIYSIKPRSHPVRVRGLKLFFALLLFSLMRRTPCGCVD